MRIYCEKCHEDITEKVDSLFERYEVGKIQCPKCQKQQSRYVSETDILLYFGISEVFYALLTVITVLIFIWLGVHWYSIVILLGIFVGSVFLQKTINRLIYEKAYFKSDIKTHEFKEDKKQIRSSMQWQFMLFFAIAITFITLGQFQIFFGCALILSIVLTFIKFKLSLNREREETNTGKKKKALK